VERSDRAPVATFFTELPLVEGETISLETAAAQHVRVRRLQRGARLRLVDGRGRVATAALSSLGKREVTVSVEHVLDMPKPTPLEVIMPIADRDRMLLAAEKCVELQVTSWRPVYFARSRSVSPRGEGEKFHEKIVARMRSALEQSGGAWMPDVHTDMEIEGALHSVPESWNRLILHAEGIPIAAHTRDGPTAIAVGPEGGIESTELDAAVAAGWRAASLGTSILRFETAAIAAAAIVRAAQHSTGSP
jgi:16S rRNA (uracil1498-N3)-methyltransferase